METIVSPKKRLNESFSRKEVTFCEESSILFYAVEGTVDSLNDGERHIVKNNNFPLSPETLNTIKNSNIMGSDSKYTSEQCLNNLPEAMVVLEKLPEDLFHKYAYLNNDMHCCIIPTRTRNTYKTSSLNSDSCHLEKFTEPVVNEISPVLQKSKYQLRSSKSSLSHKCIDENYENETVDAYSRNISGKVPKLNNAKRKPSKALKNSTKHSLSTDHPLDSIPQSFLQNSVRLSSPTKSKTSKCVNKSNIGKKDNVKLNNSTTSVDIMSERNCDKISFDKYPCIHLERLNLKSYLESVSNPYNCLQNKKDVPMDLDIEVGNIIDNLAGLSMSSKSVPLKEVFSKTVNSSSPLIDIEGNSDLSLSEETYPEKSKKTLLPVNSPEIPSNVDDSLPESSLRDETFLQNENIAKDVICENSSHYSNTQNKFPFVLLEKLILPLIGTDIKFGTDSSELICTDSVSTDINGPDLPLQIKNVCSISRKSFNKTQNHIKTFSKNIVKKNRKNDKSSPNLCYADEFKEREISIINPTSSHINSCNSSESSLENLSTTSNGSINEDISLISLSKQKSMNAETLYNFTDSSLNDLMSDDIPLVALSNQVLVNPHLFNDSTDSSLNDSTNDDIPLISLSMQKLLNDHSFHGYSDSSNCNTTLINLVGTNSKNSQIKPHKHKKKNSINRKSLTIATKANSSHTKSCKHKKRNSLHGNASSNLQKTVATKTKNLHIKPQQYQKNPLPCNSKYSPNSKKTLNSQTLFEVSNKMMKNNKCSKSIELSPLTKKKKKKSFKKHQVKIYKMMIKYLKLQIKSKKHKKKSNKKKLMKKLVSSNDKDDSCSNDSVAVIYDSTELTDKNSFQKDETSAQCKTLSLGESSVERNGKSKIHKKNFDKYRIGFLSNKHSLRFYNKFLASERLLLSKCKKNKKKEFKRLFNKLKTVGFMNYK